MNKVTHLTHEGKEKEAMPFPGLLFGAPFVGGFLGGCSAARWLRGPFIRRIRHTRRIQAGGINQRFMKEEWG
ncbi:hypothetical protein QT238_16280 [Geobacillus stearothermophilus]|nr:hypothetical protein QT238_16280 [Geobacillus stearothermophilus]